MGIRRLWNYSKSTVEYHEDSPKVAGWGLLLKHIAPNALHDSSARYDAPKCDEDTRVEVTGEIMDWIQDRSAPQRVLCMTGAAGSGKSALQQTIAERCANTDILGAAFFLSSTDPTRNRASTVVGTIAYQLGLKHPLFQSSIIAAVKRDPLIFSRSIRSQMEGLIVLPFENLRRSAQVDIDTFPYAILIDGLDECKGEPNDTVDPTHLDDRLQAEDRQAELLAAIRHCILANDLPFRVFIASRPEWAVRTALEPGGDLHQVAYCIQLSDQYDASRDMYRYLRRRFDFIGLRIRNPQWFTEDDINTLVEAASGQFIYVATMFKYISERRASPTARLKIVLTWTPDKRQGAQAFEALDRLYTNILLAAKNAYEAVDTHQGRDFLLLFKTHHSNVAGFDNFKDYTLVQPPAEILSALLGLEAGAEESLISDLRSLVTLETDAYGGLRLRLYHKSFSDFLEEETRAKALFVSKSRVKTHLAKCLMQQIIECPLDFDSLPAKWEELPLPVLYRRSLKAAVEDLPLILYIAPALDDEVRGFTQNGGWQKVDSLLPLLSSENRKPEVAAAMSEFVEKWKCNEREWMKASYSR
ncbi:hypothetical protein EST38_g10096 [Candolleomyces aberdarensis]|uniref:Nephrocystin 3-like N-terminal domain-containing protein n=1 Tax=Candolleomyces aberdarensis TaxID=2316362 RepID=A0A4Q2DBJ4_9AGAR|nr:hypothetical protein EST38_g10096 [Candolleomyces aberdarensis]